MDGAILGASRARRRPHLRHAERFAFEREAALHIGLLLPKVVLGCLEALEGRWWCSGSGERRASFDCGSSVLHLPQPPHVGQRV